MPVNEVTGEHWEYNEPPMLLIGIGCFRSAMQGRRRSFPPSMAEQNPWLDNAMRALEDFDAPSADDV